MNWQTTEMSYGLIEELEWPDFWDDYERATHGFADAHDAPRERFGIPDDDKVCLQQQLRILDPTGDCLARLKRAQESLGKAECALRSKLELLPDQWRSDKAFHRILCVLNLNECSILQYVANAFQKMHVDNDSLSDLVALARSKHGFSLALDAIVRVGTKQARQTLLQIANETNKVESENKEQCDARKILLNDAAVALSVKLNDRHVIPILVNRLIAAYSKTEESGSKTSAIIGDILGVIRHAHRELTPTLLEQLARLGGAEADEASYRATPKENSSLGVEQAMIARDLRPIRDAARQEIKRRKIAS